MTPEQITLIMQAKSINLQIYELNRQLEMVMKAILPAKPSRNFTRQEMADMLRGGAPVKKGKRQ